MAQSEEQENGGTPVRAIHQAWLSMMDAVQQFHRADHIGEQSERSDAQINLQHNILDLYELLRPYLRDRNAVEDYWNGKPPGYGGQEGVAVLATQERYDTVPIDNLAIPDGGELQLKALDEQLGLADNVLVAGAQVERNESAADLLLVRLRSYECGLSQLDSWLGFQETVSEDKGGFLKGERAERTVTHTVGQEKLMNAARALQEAADELGALAPFEDGTPRTEITEDLIQEVDKWRQQNLE